MEGPFLSLMMFMMIATGQFGQSDHRRAPAGGARAQARARVCAPARRSSSRSIASRLKLSSSFYTRARSYRKCHFKAAYVYRISPL